MAKKWYPVIDYVSCVECGACVDMCPHGVYDKGKAPTPVVIYSDGCIEGCRGCGNRCPASAIEYVGDIKGSLGEEHNCNCGCGNEGCC